MPRGYNNYSFVVDSTFRPFSFQEMLAPYAIYKDAYEKAEESYVDLSSKADKFKYLADTLDPDSKAAQIYNNYANELKAQAIDLANNGLSIGNRSALTNLKRRYQGEIGRLVEADALRKQQWDEQRKMQLQNPTMLFSRRADRTSLDDYLDNPTLGYESYNGALLTQQVGAAASSIAKGLNDYVQTGRLDQYTKTWIENHGFSKEQVALAISNPHSPDAPKVLTALVDDAVISSGIPQWADSNTLKRAYQYANMGLWNAVGQSTVHQFNDYGAQLAASEASSIRKAMVESQLRQTEKANEARLAAEAAQAGGAGGTGGIAINPLNIYSRKDIEQQKHNIDNYEKYFVKGKNGGYRMTQEGLNEYNRKVKAPGNTIVSPTGIVTEVGGGEYTDSPFKQFVDSLGGAKYIKDGKMMPGNLGNLWSYYKRESKHDATKSTEFDYTLYDSQRKDMKLAIQTAIRDGKLYEVDFDNKTNTFKPSGDSLTAEDLNNDKYTIQSTRFSPYGATVMIKDDKGNVKRYNLPRGINPVNEANRDKAMSAAAVLQQIITAKAYKGNDGKMHDMSPEELVQAQQQYKRLLQQAYMYHSQLGVSNKVKEQEFNPYSY
jgi:hypothetical protein